MERERAGDGTSCSVVIPVRNDASYLDRCLRALERQTHPPDEIVVVDNASTDGLAAVLARRPEVRCVREPVRGVAVAAATGYDAARGDLILRCDADSVPAPTWVERHVRVLSEARVRTGGEVGGGVETWTGIEAGGGSEVDAGADGAARAERGAAAGSSARANGRIGRSKEFPPGSDTDAGRGREVVAVSGIARFGPRLPILGRMTGAAYITSYRCVAGTALGHWALWGSNMAFTRAWWEQVSPEVHRDPRVHDDFDLSFRVRPHQRVLLDPGNAAVVSWRAVVSPARIRRQLRMATATLLANWVDERPWNRWERRLGWRKGTRR